MKLLIAWLDIRSIGIVFLLTSNIRTDDTIRQANDGAEELALSRTVMDTTALQGENLKPGGSQTSVIGATMAGTNMTTNAGETISNTNTSYVNIEGDHIEESENQWVEHGPMVDGTPQFSTDGKTYNLTKATQKAGYGFELSNSSTVHAVNDEDGNESFGKKTSSVDGTFGQDKSTFTEDSETEWTTAHIDGSTSVGDKSTKLNKTSHTLNDVNNINVTSQTMNKYADGTVVYMENNAENATTDNYSQDTSSDKTKLRWSDLAASGATSVGVTEGLEESNRTAGNGTGSENAMKVWDVRTGDVLNVGNLTRSQKNNYTMEHTGQRKNASSDIANMAADGSISLVKGKQQKEGVTGDVTTNLESNSTAAYLQKKSDGSRKLGMVKQAKTENMKQNSGNITDNSQVKWTNFTAPGQGTKLGEKPGIDVMPDDVKQLVSGKGGGPKTVSLAPPSNRASFKRPV